LKASYPTPLTTSNALELVVKQPSEAEPIENRAPEIFGRPNSSGILRVIDGTYGVFSSESTGVFKVMPGTNKINVTVSGGYQGDNHANFDLSGGNSIYGASSTVQPKTMRGYWLIRF